MSEEQGAGCVRPTAASATEVETEETYSKQATPSKKEQIMVQVGQKAPDFTAPGFHNGAFVNDVKLSDYLGKWVVLCFYPGDFTFV